MKSALPIAKTIVGAPLAVATFATGWAMQFAGHSVATASGAREFTDAWTDDLTETAALELVTHRT
jgi:hypothetical protein